MRRIWGKRGASEAGGLIKRSGGRRAAPVVLACLLAAVIAGISLADSVVPDGDVVATGDQGTVNLGTVAPGAVLTPKTSFHLVCDSKNHVDQGQTLTLTYSSSGSIIPAGSMTATNATIGPIPASWPTIRPVADRRTAPLQCRRRATTATQR